MRQKHKPKACIGPRRRCHPAPPSGLLDHCTFAAAHVPCRRTQTMPPSLVWKLEAFVRPAPSQGEPSWKIAEPKAISSSLNFPRLHLTPANHGIIPSSRARHRQGMILARVAARFACYTCATKTIFMLHSALEIFCWEADFVRAVAYHQVTRYLGYPSCCGRLICRRSPKAY